VPARLGETTVATIAAVVVGFVVAHDDEIEQLYVDDAARGTGIAATLLGHGEAVIARSCHQAWLAVAAGNARARRFYERHGWFDAGAFTYRARTAAGTSVAVPVRRYEKHLATHTEGSR
jgi:ribosomal protein S18 acetylase RimI-like enzyme